MTCAFTPEGMISEILANDVLLRDFLNRALQFITMQSSEANVLLDYTGKTE